jgi:hypothetical protein
LRERWPIPKAIRKPLIERLNEVVQDTDSSPREVTAAARAILEASRVNLESVGVVIRVQEHEELVARLTELEQRVGGTNP